MEFRATEIVGIPNAASTADGAEVVFDFIDRAGRPHAFGCPRERVAEIVFKLSAAAQEAMRLAGKGPPKVGEFRAGRRSKRHRRSSASTLSSSGCW
jgi:hypothetical protein